MPETIYAMMVMNVLKIGATQARTANTPLLMHGATTLLLAQLIPVVQMDVNTFLLMSCATMVLTVPWITVMLGLANVSTNLSTKDALTVLDVPLISAVLPLAVSHLCQYTTGVRMVSIVLLISVTRLLDVLLTFLNVLGVHSTKMTKSASTASALELPFKNSATKMARVPYNYKLTTEKMV
jgi:hypothetical protein